MENKRTVWYFGLEPLKERYTAQLSEKWMPETFRGLHVDFFSICPNFGSNEIKNGFVLDSINRGVYSMCQCQSFLTYLREGSVKDNDIILLQDFWTPGFESIIYALQMAGIKCKIYSMLHAQTVDEYDFTYKMRGWMRHFELGLDAVHDGIFVGSTIHREQLKAAGFTAPIHVMGLPINKNEISNVACEVKKNQVVFTSRFDKEKNPFFLLEVAKRFLKFNPDWKFIVTTSADSLRSSINDIPEVFKRFAQEDVRFVIKEGLSKADYYDILAESKIQFNCSMQDYVSWTMLEAINFDCGLVYPYFRSFPELLEVRNFYKAFDVEDAVSTLCMAAINRIEFINTKPLELSDLGRRFEAYIMMNDIKEEFNVWHESEYIKHLLDEDNRGRR